MESPAQDLSPSYAVRRRSGRASFAIRPGHQDRKWVSAVMLYVPLPKLREDQRRCGADVALIISHALPKHIEHFDLFDGVWVAHPRCALPVAVALRQSLIELSSSKLVQQGQQTKMEQVYEYLTGSRFRQRVDAVVEKFNDMREDLDKERKFMGRQWAKRETQIVAVVESTVGMVGDLQAIAGKAMPEIASLETPLLEGPGEVAA